MIRSRVSRGQVLARHAAFEPQRCEGKTTTELGRHKIPDEPVYSETDSCVCNAYLRESDPQNEQYNGLAEQVLGRRARHAVDELAEQFADETDEISDSLSYLVGLALASDRRDDQQWLISELKRLDRQMASLSRREERCGLTTLTLAYQGRLRSQVDRVVRQAHQRQMRELSVSVDVALDNLTKETDLVHQQLVRRLQRIVGAFQLSVDPSESLLGDLAAEYSQELAKEAEICRDLALQEWNTDALRAFLSASCVLRETLHVRRTLDTHPVFRDIK